MNKLLIQYIDEFESYLNRTMSKSEQTAFEQQMAEQPALADAYRAYKKTNSLLLKHEEDGEISEDDKAEAEQIQALAEEDGLLLDEDDIFEYSLHIADEKTVARIENRKAQDATFAALVASYEQIASGISAFSNHYKEILETREILEKEGYFDRINEKVAAEVKREQLKARWVNIGYKSMIAASIATLIVSIFVFKEFKIIEPMVVTSPDSQIKNTQTLPKKEGFNEENKSVENRITETQTPKIEPSKANAKKVISKRKVDAFVYDFGSDMAIAKEIEKSLKDSTLGFSGGSGLLDTVWNSIALNDFHAAIEHLKFLNDHSGTQREEYAYGIALLSKGELKEAGIHFEKATKGTIYPEIGQHAQWLRAYCLYKMEDSVRCIESLNEIIQDTKHPFATQATSLLKTIK